MNINELPAGAVVVGVDGSRDSDHAVDWAAEHARNENRDLVLLHAGAEPDATGQAVLDAAAARVAQRQAGARVHRVIARLDPRAALLEASERASVVVVGSRGHGPVATLLLGSGGAAVVGRSRCPAVVVRPHHPGKVRRGVLVAVDGSAGSVRVLDFAFRQASEKALPLTVLHAEPGDVEDESAALTLAEVMAGMGEKYPDVPVRKVFVRGTPKGPVLKYADTMNVVVLGEALGVVKRAGTVVAVVPQR